MTREEDEDQTRLFSITRDFLQMYFGHTEESARVTLERFLDRYGDLYDEYFFFHESSYRLAAIIHFVEDLHGSVDDVHDWITNSPHATPPTAAVEHFNRSFWGRSVSDGPLAAQADTTADRPRETPRWYARVGAFARRALRRLSVARREG